MSSAVHNPSVVPRVLHAYLLGRLDFETLLALQRRLVYDVSGDRDSAALVLCEHPHGITIGREGSAGHVGIGDAELRARGWPVRWVNRGGGCLLSAPGQVAAYAVLALDRFGLNLQEYLDRLHRVVTDALRELDVPAELRPPAHGVWVEDRRIAHVGVAVRDWVSSFGFTVNVDPDLKPFALVQCDGGAKPMTSVERERRTRARPATVRQRLLDAFAAAFGFERVSLFHNHSSLTTKVPAHAVATRPG
jgi:lipoyl(octanoyl) transferase